MSVAEEFFTRFPQSTQLQNVSQEHITQLNELVQDWCITHGFAVKAPISPHVNKNNFLTNNHGCFDLFTKILNIRNQIALHGLAAE
jgi:hypothetical protein